MEKITRGMRNNNPFNIRKSDTKWFGKIPGKDNDFETFDTLYNGYRAGIVLLRTYINKYHCRTIWSIINRFAPASENDVDAYVDFISRRCNRDPHIKLSDRFILEVVASEIAEYESHCSLPEAVVKQIIYNVNKEYE